MNKTFSITFIVLIALTVLTALLSAQIEHATRWVVAGIMGIAVVKFLLVAFQFMELKKAHGFWKFSVLLLCGFIVVGMAVMSTFAEVTVD